MIAPPDTIVLGDTVPVTVEALNRDGSVIPGAPVFLLSSHPDTIAVGPDSLTVIGLAAPGGANITAGIQNLRSAPFRIVVRAP